jgi:hypothetical protein
MVTFGQEELFVFFVFLYRILLCVKETYILYKTKHIPCTDVLLCFSGMKSGLMMLTRFCWSEFNL